MSAVEHAVDVGVELRELRCAVLALREELDRRDVETMELEGVVEFLLHDNVIFRPTLDRLVMAVFGRDSAEGKEMSRQLYPDTGPYGIRQAAFARWHRPARRWAQFGSRDELANAAKMAGVKVRSGGSRMDIIRALWRADKLPGGVGPHTRLY